MSVSALVDAIQNGELVLLKVFCLPRCRFLALEAGSASFGELRRLVGRLFGVGERSFHLVYRDAEDDQITIASEQDMPFFLLAAREMQGRAVKVTVVCGCVGVDVE